MLQHASQRWPHPHHMSLITPASEAWESISLLSNSFSARPRFACAGMSVKVARGGDVALGIAARADLFSPPTSHPSPPLCVSLFLPFYVSPLSLFFPSLTSGQRKALTPRLLPGLHCQLFFIFHGEAGGLVQRTRKGEGENAEKLLCPSSLCLLSLTSTSCPLASHRADLHASPSIPFNSPFFLLSFLLIFACPSLQIMHTCVGAHTQAHAHAKMVSRGAVDGKITY